MKILFVAPLNVPYADDSLNSVMMNITLFARCLQTLGHEVAVGCIAGSRSDVLPLICFDGIAEPSIYAGGTLTEIAAPGSAQTVADFINAQAQQWDAILIKGMERRLYCEDVARHPQVFYFPNVCNVPQAFHAQISATARSTGLRTVFLSAFQCAHFGGHTKRHTILPCPFDLDALPRPHYATHGNPLWAARIHPHKGLHHALELARRAEYVLDVAGPIEDAPYFGALCKRFDNLNYLGALPPRSLWQRMAEATFFLQTQQWKEAFGRTTIEAGLCGTPVIAIARGANTELIDHGRTGVLFEPHTKDLRVSVRAAQHLDRRAVRLRLRNRYGAQQVSRQLERSLMQARSN